MEISKIKVITAFSECAGKCPEFELVVDKVFCADGGMEYYPDFKCAHFEKCDLIYNKFKRSI